MPFPMKIQPIDSTESTIRSDVVAKTTPVLRSRLKRLFDRPFNSVMRISAADKPVTVAAGAEFEPSTVCLDKMVRNFMEESNEKPIAGAQGIKCGRNRCNCFNGNGNGNSNDSSDDELDFSDSLTANSSSFFRDPSDALKCMVQCANAAERNLLADTSKIVEKHTKTCKRKSDLTKVVADGLITLGYNASVCKSKWDKSSFIPAGEYKYIDVIIDGERLFVDVDFRSEFEIARSTSSYRAILQSLPHVFVGKSDRLLQIISITSDAARHSLRKKGMHIAPWRKTEYIKSKWLSPHTRVMLPESAELLSNAAAVEPQPEPEVPEGEVGELDLIFGEDTSLPAAAESVSEGPKSPEKEVSPATAWQLPALRPRSFERGSKVVVTGLASLLQEKL